MISRQLLSSKVPWSGRTQYSPTVHVCFGRQIAAVFWTVCQEATIANCLDDSGGVALL